MPQVYRSLARSKSIVAIAAMRSWCMRKERCYHTHECIKIIHQWSRKEDAQCPSTSLPTLPRNTTLKRNPRIKQSEDSAVDGPLVGNWLSWSSWPFYIFKFISQYFDVTTQWEFLLQHFKHVITSIKNMTPCECFLCFSSIRKWDVIQIHTHTHTLNCCIDSDGILSVTKHGWLKNASQTEPGVMLMSKYKLHKVKNHVSGTLVSQNLWGTSELFSSLTRTNHCLLMSPVVCLLSSAQAPSLPLHFLIA